MLKCFWSGSGLIFFCQETNLLEFLTKVNGFSCNVNATMNIFPFFIIYLFKFFNSVKNTISIYLGFYKKNMLNIIMRSLC